MDCKKKLYNDDTDLTFLTSIVKESDLTDVSAIVSALRSGGNFAVSLEEAENEDEFADNIKDNLIPDLIAFIEKVKKGKILNSLLYQLRKQFLDAFLPIDNVNTIDEVPTTKAPNDVPSKKPLLRTIKDTFFGKDTLLKNYQLEEFKKQLRNFILFDNESPTKTIVYDLDTLNRNLQTFRLKLYEIIYDYLGSDAPVTRRTMLTKDTLTEYEGVQKNLEAFYNMVIAMPPESRERRLADDWENIVMNKASKTLLEAINAYISLQYFDNLIEQSVGKFLTINRRLDSPVSLKLRGSRLIKVYKYNFGIKTTNMLKDFRETMLNALDTMGNFSKFLIEGIPRLESDSTLTQVQFLNALLHLKTVIPNLTGENKYVRAMQKAVKSLHTNPALNWKILLDNFSDYLKKPGGLKNLTYGGSVTLTHDDIIILLSIHKFLYGNDRASRKQSIYNLEQSVHDSLGYKEIYPILDTLLGTIDSISEMNYLEVKYDGKLPIVQVKPKYFIDKAKLDLSSSILSGTTETTSINSSYNFESKFDNATFKIDDLTFTVLPKYKDSDLGILDKDLEIKVRYQGRDTDIETFFLDIKLMGIQTRRNFINSLETTDVLLKKLLHFIDGALNTEFSDSLEGLLKFEIYRQSMKGTGIKALIGAAARVYAIKKVHTAFLEAIDNREINQKTGKPFEIVDLRDWLRAHTLYSNITQLFNSTNKSLYTFILGEELLRAIPDRNTEWINQVCRAAAIISGETLRATTKDFNKNNIPNYSPAFLGAEIKEELEYLKNTTLRHLLFVNNPSSITSAVIDTDVRTINGEHKAVSDMTEPELQYHMFYDKFLVPFSEGYFYAQPTVYSDKKKFINYRIRLSDLKDFIKDNETIRKSILETLGTYYKEINLNVLTEFQKLNPGFRTVYDIDAFLKTLTVDSLMELVRKHNENNPNNLVELIEDVHYRILKRKLGFNETLNYYTNYVFTPENIGAFLEEACVDYINTLIKSGTFFKGSNDEKIKNAFDSIKVNRKPWFDGDYMIFAKITKKDGSTRKVIDGEEISLEEGDKISFNPLIERFVLLHNLINNNLRESLIGSDIVHKIKALKKRNTANGFTVEEQTEIAKYFSEGTTWGNATMIDVDVAIAKMPNSLPYRKKFDREMKSIINLAQNAQLKRTVTVPGIMRYYLQDTLTGIGSTLRGAVISDVQATAFNFDGQEAGIDAHDGGAFLNPITAILQNRSLQDSEVGTIIKPLWHADIPRYGCKRLVKFAAHTMTNEWMVQSEGSAISFYRMFKKMTDKKFPFKSTIEHNLLNLYLLRSEDPYVSFDDITDGERIYYNLGNQYFRITDFLFDEGGYYTVEDEISVSALTKDVTVINGTEAKYYHYFDDEGNHYKVKAGESQPESTHTIQNIFELHSTLGGIYAMSYTGEELVRSEISNRAVANIINMYTELTPEAEAYTDEDRPKTLKYYRQPLKEIMVDYLLNQSSIKNGTGNINNSSVYLDDTPLQFITLDSRRLGIQLDSDHEADEAELTEMSQVINSIDAGGYYHDTVKELYEAIGMLSLQASQIELDKLKEFQTNGNYSQLYDIIGRTLIKNLAGGRSGIGMAEAIVHEIKELFGFSIDHINDIFKIPFSDRNIHNQILSTISSILNKKSVKRKFPGTGQVMVPGYNISQIWDINGKPVLYADLISEAKAAGFTSNATDVRAYNKDIVKQFLDSYLKSHQVDIVVSRDSNMRDALLDINPLDTIEVVVGNNVTEPIQLISIRDYYEFKKNPFKFVADRSGFILGDEIIIRKRHDVARDLAPLKLRFSFTTEDGVVHYRNIFDIEPLLAMYETDLKNANEAEKIILRNAVQKTLDDIDKGIYTENGVTYNITIVENKAAETIMSNIYRSKFGIKPNESLYDILKAGPKRFEVDVKSYLPKESVYDLALMKTNGEGLFIAFNSNELRTFSGMWKVKSKQFKNITKEDREDVAHEVFLLSDDNIKIAPIGVDIDVTDEIEEVNGTYRLRNTQEPVKGDYYTENGKVYKYVLFLEEKSVTPKFKEAYKVYNINIENIREVYKTDEKVKAKVNEIVESLYKADNYSFIAPNSEINPNSIKHLTNVLTHLRKRSHDGATRDYLKKLLGGISFAEQQTAIRPGITIKLPKYSGYFKDYAKILAERRYSSFIRSLDFISSRIPGQSLQSFMKMTVVGYSGAETNQAIVSHWLAWLLGSDYRLNLCCNH